MEDAAVDSAPVVVVVVVVPHTPVELVVELLVVVVVVLVAVVLGPVAVEWVVAVGFAVMKLVPASPVDALKIPATPLSTTARLAAFAASSVPVPSPYEVVLLLRGLPRLLLPPPLPPPPLLHPPLPCTYPTPPS